ncbi:MAG: hypothetical protein SOT71_04785 [Romboutsia timonensis]|uniref:hypothetical protein n=1 Tax=Romboutsia timonensis TaxID=1776391 RepID=UPI002A754BEB|nr:hypothetical protein [Romboutsia timonensis]MDY2881949.1 hypothetical protein [Romboutsia timonensis]
MNSNLRFILKITGIHILTYIFCGIIFSTLFNYDSLFAMNGVGEFMKEVGGTSTLIGPLVQVIRGILFGIVLLLIKDTFMERKYGWLKLWIILSIVGIINTPAPAPFSIEGIVYTKLPLEFHLKGAPEILVQTLLFSYLSAKPSSKKKKVKFIEYNKNEFIASTVGMVLFSLSGIVLALIRGVDIAHSVSDIGAFGVMFVAVISIFFISKYYPKIENKFKDVLVAVSLYFVLAVLPYIYNLITNSPFNTYLTLLINIIPAMILFFIIKFNYKNAKQFDGQI